MNARNGVLAACLIFIATMAFFTLRDLVVNGITPLAIVSLPIVVVLAIGIFGALGQPPRR